MICFPRVASTRGQAPLPFGQGAWWVHLAQVGQPPLDKTLTTQDRPLEGAAWCSHRACAGAWGGLGHRGPVTALCAGSRGR